MSVALSIDDLRPRVGQEVAVSDWFTVTQDVINEFAATTRDMQWIHVDTERAARESPFRNADGQRCTVAHGFLTLALLTPLFESGLTITGAHAGVNIGFERLRFEGPVPAGSRIRGHFTLAAFEEVRGGAQLNWDVSVEREQDARVVLSARWLTRVWR
ncbi:MAG TPA: MaoC family dehydratase [Burkholderiaceae bacterium]|nr:MaoC family dehydratase [Burkholderiaceae bacterium]HQR78269.1 MaoC family dehydratase [Burkholderiaceae bacterium]